MAIKLNESFARPLFSKQKENQLAEIDGTDHPMARSHSMSHLQLLTDQALGEGNDTSFDGLNFSTYARILGNAALGTAGPLTIGVFGEWGTGKTSLMRMIQSNLDKEKCIVTVWFNAWRYEQEEHPIVPLIATIVRELDRHKTFVEEVKSKSDELIRALRAVAYGFSAKSKVKIPGFAEVEAAFVAKDMIDREATTKSDPLLDRSLYYEAFERLSSLPRKDDIKIVVLVDDLDRCFPDLAIRLLESIKLVLCQPGFIFILGVARRVIEGYLEFRYNKEFGIEDFEGRSYLDKIVQVPFYIPTYRSRMNSFTEKLIARIDPSLHSQFEPVLPIISLASGGNPRSTVRFVNNLLIDAAIYKDLAELEDKTAIQFEYFAVTRCLQHRWPQVFSKLLSSDQLCLAVAVWDSSDFLNESTSSDTSRSSIATILLGDPDLRCLFGCSQGKAWLTNSDQRNAAAEFLRTQRKEEVESPRMASKEYDVYFSYASTDKVIVAQVADTLVSLGLSVYLGGDLSDMPSIIERSRSIAIFLSPASLESTWVKAELNYVFGCKIPIYPILLPGADSIQIPLPLSSIQAIDLRNGVITDASIKLAQLILK